MKFIRYTDLVERGVVNSRMTLKRLIDFHEFPPGRLLTPNARAWTEDEIDEWVQSRPTASKTSLRVKGSSDAQFVHGRAEKQKTRQADGSRRPNHSRRTQTKYSHD
jgi:predicted DNA-binding transcriptional regulator AlpA